MNDIGIFQTTISILKKYNFSLQKKYGQNFLVDSYVLNKIVDAAEITTEDVILEIGPGIGTMTQLLCQSAKKVIAIEIDQHLIPILKDTLSDYKNIILINEDILKVDIPMLIEKYNDNKPIKVVANLPYYITTPIIMKLLESQLPILNLTVMIQKEVAKRMQVGPGTKEYGALSLAIQYYTTPYLVANVPSNCFIPRPNVDSAVIRLTKHIKCPVNIQNEKFLFDIIHASFCQRRKTLVNGLTNASKLGLQKEQIITVLETMKLSPSIRGETLDLQQFSILSNLLWELSH